MEISEISVLKKILFFAGAAGVLIVLWDFVIRRCLSRLSKMILAAGTVLISLGIWAFIIEPNWIQVTKLQIHDQALAAVLEDTRIVQLSDIHLTQGLGFRERQMIEKVNALNPDIIVFTGDLFDSTSQIPSALEIFKLLKAKLSILGIPGDTDLIFVSSQKFEQAMSPVMHVLRNKTGRLSLSNGKGVWISGIDNPSGGNLKAALGGVPPGEPVILLSPSPEIFADAARLGINLVLTGDTHGGQVGIDFLIRMSEYANRGRYMKGLFHSGFTQMYVNRGIGVKTRPIRFLCRPEITLIQVVP